MVATQKTPTKKIPRFRATVRKSESRLKAAASPPGIRRRTRCRQSRPPRTRRTRRRSASPRVSSLYSSLLSRRQIGEEVERARDEHGRVPPGGGDRRFRVVYGLDVGEAAGRAGRQFAGRQRTRSRRGGGDQAA